MSLPVRHKWGFTVLLPLSLGWAVATFIRRKLYRPTRRYASPLPIVCVGNLHSGGSGKTPLLFAMASQLKHLRPVLLSRGYGGSLSKQGAWVEPGAPDGPALYGEEPWWLMKETGLPTYVGADRRNALRKIESTHPGSLVLMDDGFQHLAVLPTVSLVCLQIARDWKESYCLPLGDLREPFSSLSSASAVILVGTGEARFAEWESLLRPLFPTLSLFRARKIDYGVWDKETRVFSPRGLAGFCGVASPAGFEEDLRGFPESDLVRAYPDHHVYSSSDVTWLVAEKKRLGKSALVTTEKDLAKLTPLFEAAGESLLCHRIRYEIDEDFWYFLEQRLEPK